METLKPLTFGIDAYEDWVRREGLPITEGIAVNALEMPVGDWPRYEAKGGIGHCVGRGDFANLFVLEIPAGKATAPVQHIFESTCYVLDGRGSTQLEFADGTKRSFEWAKNSFFAIPLNAKYRHFNTSGTQRARMTMVTNAPLLMKTFHNDDFIFNSPFMFADRVGREEWYGGEGELHMFRPGANIWETNFVPDMLAIELTEWEDRGKGSTNIQFALAGSVQHTHISEIAPATYKKGHRHGSGTHVMTLSGHGYSLLWYPGKEDDLQRVDWSYGVVFPPCDQQFHQHFVTSNNASRYVAVGASSSRYPLQESRKRAYFGNGEKSATSLSVKLGGDQIEYEDQNPRIHQIWLEEMKKAGITPKLDLPPRA
jgi:hypothetical protein